MERVSLRAYAKINLGLDITGKRADGYHLLKTVMQTIDISDGITVTKDPAGQKEEIRITSDSAALPADPSNIAWKAAAALKKKYEIKTPVLIDIEKNIPMAAGLGGGSADGAAVLKALNGLFGLKAEEKDLEEIAAGLGADVPFCLRKGLCLCEGIGEILTPLPALEGVWAVIIKPVFDVSTKWCYGEFDRLGRVSHPDMEGEVKAIRSGDLSLMCARMGNVLEQACAKAHPEIEKIKEEMVCQGAEVSCMSGSGSTVFGLFKDKGRAGEALEYFKNKNCFEKVFLTGFVY